MCTLTQAYRNEKEALLVQTSVLLRGVSSVYKVKMILKKNEKISQRANGEEESRSV